MIELGDEGYNKNEKTEKKKKTVLSSFAHKRQVILKNQLKRKLQIKIYSQKQMAIMTWSGVLKIEKVYLWGRSEVRQKKIKRSAKKSNLNINAEPVSLR